MTTTVFTIGHSRHAIERFVGLLAVQGVETLIDVRSHPTSRWAPQFRRRELERALAEHGIAYVFLGEALGGRPEGEWYDGDDGRLDVNARAGAPDFMAGIAQLLAIAGHGTAAIMCAEENPASCHRRTLVTPALVRAGICVVHLRGDGEIQPERG